MRCNSGRDELEHAVFQVEIYGGERDGQAPRTARLSTFSVTTLVFPTLLF